MIRLFIFLSIPFLFFACCTPEETPIEKLSPEVQASMDSSIYRSGIQYAMYPEAFKVYDELIAITRENKRLKWKVIDGEEYVLMVSWKGYIQAYEPYKDTGFYPTGDQYPIWVSAAPELLDRMKSERYLDTNRRLLQLLGLPPNGKYTHFVEFWVRPADLFRPCPDPEITDTRCEVCLSQITDTAFQDWINSTRIARYYPCDLYSQYPWTALGYTYDWDPENLNHIGVSEFVIRNNAKIKVENILTTSEYLNK